jgi:hypothetical protein
LNVVEVAIVSGPIHFFETSDETPRSLEDVRITGVRVEVMPDNRRVLVSVDLTPFFEKPSFDVTLLRDGVEERTASVVGAMSPHAQLTMHLPPGDPGGSYVVRVDLLDGDATIRQTETVSFEIPQQAP